MENEIQQIKEALKTIKERNKRVEAAKAWETSWSRKMIIAVITYALIVIFMFMSDFRQPFLEALVPTAAYLISMSSLSFFQKWWINAKIKD